jgi:hypothetical protein
MKSKKYILLIVIIAVVSIVTVISIIVFRQQTTLPANTANVEVNADNLFNLSVSDFSNRLNNVAAFKQISKPVFMGSNHTCIYIDNDTRVILYSQTNTDYLQWISIKQQGFNGMNKTLSGYISGVLQAFYPETEESLRSAFVQSIDSYDYTNKKENVLYFENTIWRASLKKQNTFWLTVFAQPEAVTSDKA